MTSIMEPSWTDTINVPNCTKKVHQPQHNHGRTDHGLKCLINHGKVIGNINNNIHQTRFSISKRAGESVAASAGAKQKPVCCSRLIVTRIGDKNANVDNHAVLPPDYKAGGDSKREELCQQNPQTFTFLATGASSSFGRAAATEEKMHLHPNTDGEKYIRKFDDPAQNFQPQSEEEHDFVPSSIEQ